MNTGFVVVLVFCELLVLGDPGAVAPPDKLLLLVPEINWLKHYKFITIVLICPFFFLIHKKGTENERQIVFYNNYSIFSVIFYFYMNKVSSEVTRLQTSGLFRLN